MSEVTIEILRTIIKAQELNIEFLNITRRYLETLLELERRPTSIVKCAKVVSEVTILLENAVKRFSSSIKTNQMMCKSAKRIVEIHSDLLLKLDRKTYETQKALLIKMLEDGSNKIDVGQGQLQHNSKVIKKVVGKLSIAQFSQKIKCSNLLRTCIFL